MNVRERVLLAAAGGILIGAGVAVLVLHHTGPADAAPGTTPPACLTALDMASDGFTASGDALDAARDAVDAARRGDTSGTRRAEDAMAQASSRLDDLAPAAGRAAHACRAGR